MDAAQPITSAPEVVGCADHYAQVVKLFRSRIEALGLTFDSVDALSGFGVGSRYTAILLSGGKAMSVYSFFTLARTLALLPQFAHDETQLAELKKRADWIEMRRKGAKYRPKLTLGKHRVVKRKFYPDYLRKIAILGVEARMRKLTPRRRSQIARRAALARWRDGSAQP
jgi:hypothetical protein